MIRNNASIWRSLFMVAGCIVFAVPLAGYILNGSFMRYSGDDYCYGGILRRYGFWKAQWLSYLQVSTYHGNRFSLTLFSDLIGLFGPKANGILPGLAILLWLAGLVWIFRALVKLKRLCLDWVGVILAAEGIVFLTLHQAPDLVQSLYWRSGMLPYLAPLIANVFLVAIVLNNILKNTVQWPLVLGLFFLSLLSGGFSETGAAVQAGLWGLLGLYSLFTVKHDRASSLKVLILSGIIILGTLVSTLLLALSPVTHVRLSDLPPPPDLLSLLKMSGFHIRIFLAITRTQVWSDLLMIFIPLCLSLVYGSPGCLTKEDIVSLGRRLVWIGGGCLFLLFCCMLPSAYAQSSYPVGRALILARFVVVVAILSAFWLIGDALGRGLKVMAQPILISAFAFVILGASYTYPLLWARDIFAETPRYRRWALFWDARDAQIWELRAQGISHIEVMEIDHIVPMVRELAPDSRYWYNVCAAWYYDVDSISANQPGWDP